MRSTWAIVLVLLLLPRSIRAATIIVDEANCALVDAVTAANTDAARGGCLAGSGPDVIELTTDVGLTEANNGDNGLPVVESDITVEGGGFTIAKRVNLPWNDFRLFLVLENGTLRLNNVTLAGGESGGCLSDSLERPSKTSGLVAWYRIRCYI